MISTSDAGPPSPMRHGAESTGGTIMAEHNGAARNGALDEADSAHDDRAGRGDWNESNGHGRVRFPVDSRVVADPGGTRLMDEGHPAHPRPERPKRHRVRWIVLATIAAAILGAGWYWGVPWVRYQLETVSTDDAFVQGHPHQQYGNRPYRLLGCRTIR